VGSSPIISRTTSHVFMTIGIKPLRVLGLTCALGAYVVLPSKLDTSVR